MSKKRTLYRDMKRKAIQHLRFNDFHLISLLYKDYNYISERINFIQENFQFTKLVSVYYYNNFETMQKEIPVKLPYWIKGVSSPRRIYILNPIMWKDLAQSEEHISKIFVHEYIHVVIFNSFLSKCPVWLNEGLAQVISGQFKEVKHRHITAMYDFYNLNYNHDDFYYQSALIVSYLIRKFGFFEFINYCAKCNNFITDEFIGMKALQKLICLYLGDSE